MDSIVYIGPVSFAIIVILLFVEERFRIRYREEQTAHWRDKQSLWYYRAKELGDTYRKLGKDAEHRGFMVVFIVLDRDISERRVFVRKGKTLKDELLTCELFDFVDSYLWIPWKYDCPPNWDFEVESDMAIFTYEKEKKEYSKRR